MELWARAWPLGRKRYTAVVSCLSTAAIGVVIGMHFGFTSKTQDYLSDGDGWVPLGNVWCFLGMALSTIFCWPLPLLHGRKPYILGGLAMALVLLFPQAIAVSAESLRDVEGWRAALLVTRGTMGVSLALASTNFYSTLMDLFGASIQSPHWADSVEDGGLRRREDGMGIWLGIYTWSWLASIPLGFGIGEVVADHRPPIWGFYLSVPLLFITLVLNVLTPDATSTPYRRVVARTRIRGAASSEPQVDGTTLHGVKESPSWLVQEVHNGVLLSMKMLRQPGFLVLTLYTGWVYAQFILTMLFLVSLAGSYDLASGYSACVVFSMAVGALVSTPFQKGNVLSRPTRKVEGSGVSGEELSWSSHTIRRVAFIVLLPLAITGYVVVADGPPTSLGWPVALAAFISFLTCLAVSETNSLVMQAFDLSDLEPGTRSRGLAKNGLFGVLDLSLTRVMAGLASFHAVAFLFAAAATAVGGAVRGYLGQRVAMGVAAGVLVLLTLLLLLVLLPIREISVGSLESEAESQRPITRLSSQGDVVGPDNLSGTSRMSIFQLGSMTRWRLAGGDRPNQKLRKPTRSGALLAVSVPQAPRPPPRSAERVLGTEVIRRGKPRDGLHWVFRDRSRFHSASIGDQACLESDGALGASVRRSEAW